MRVIIWTSKPDTDALSDIEELIVGPYTLRVWKFKIDAKTGFHVECNKKWIDGRISHSPKEDATKVAVEHCCNLMMQLNRTLHR